MKMKKGKKGREKHVDRCLWTAKALDKDVTVLRTVITFGYFKMGFILSAISLSSLINVENITQHRQLSEIIALKQYYPW